MPIPKKYQFKTEEPYGWLSPGLRESLSDTIERIPENNRKKEEAKQNKKRAEFEAKKKKKHEVNQNVRKADKRFAENLTDLADEYIGGTIDQAQADLGDIFEPWFDNPIMQSPFAQSLLSGLTPTKWGRWVQDLAGAGVDVVSGKPRRPVHSPFDYTAPDMALTDHEDLDRRIDFLANILLPIKSAKVAPKLATSLGEGVTRSAKSVARPVRHYVKQAGKRRELSYTPLREEPSRVVELTPEEIAVDEVDLRAQEAQRAFIERTQAFNAQLREELDEIRSLSNRSRTLSNSTPTKSTPINSTPTHTSVSNSTNNNLIAPPTKEITTSTPEQLLRDEVVNTPLIQTFTELKQQGFPTTDKFIVSPDDGYVSYKSSNPNHGVNIGSGEHAYSTSVKILPRHTPEGYGGARTDLYDFIKNILPDYGTLAESSMAKAPNQLSAWQKPIFIATGKIPSSPIEGEYSLDVAKFLNKYYKNPEKAARKGIRIEVSPNFIMKGTNEISKNYANSFQDIRALAPDVDLTQFKLWTPEQIELWNHKYTQLYYPAIDPIERTMPYFILRKMPSKNK